HDGLGGTLFEGRAVDPSGVVNEGTFAMLGPVALFRSADGGEVGIAEQRLGSLEPASLVFADPGDEAAARALFETRAGLFPLDPSLGDARKIDATQDTLLEHVANGGAAM